MNVAPLIDAARAPLSRADTEALFHALFRGELNDTQIVAYLSATADRKPSVEELVGAVTAMRAHMRPVLAPAGAIDLCGTGGDGLGTLNISTAVSFVLPELSFVPQLQRQDDHSTLPDRLLKGNEVQISFPLSDSERQDKAYK